MPGMGELLIILVIVMLIFGAGKLPAIGDAIGRSIKNFKRAANGNDEIEVGKVGTLGERSDKSLGAGDDYAEVTGKRGRRNADDPVER